MRWITSPTITEAAISTQASAEIPRKRPEARTLSSGELVERTVFSVSVSSMPATMFIEARVARSGRMPRPTTAKPLTAPTSIPVPSVAAIATGAAMPALVAVAKTAAQRPALAASDRSMPPVCTSEPPPMMTTDMPKARMPRIADCSITLTMLKGVAKPRAVRAK